MNETDLLRLRIARLDRDREALERRIDIMTALGEDDFLDGAVIRFDKTLSNGRTYSYAAIKFNGLWSTTGPSNCDNPMTWPTLVSWLASGTPTTDVWYVDSYTKLEVV